MLALVYPRCMCVCITGPLQIRGVICFNNQRMVLKVGYEHKFLIALKYFLL